MKKLKKKLFIGVSIITVFCIIGFVQSDQTVFIGFNNGITSVLVLYLSKALYNLFKSVTIKQVETI